MLTNEILSGIRIIKFYAWEKPFGNEVNKIREKELSALTTLTYQPLTPAKAFTTVALFNILRFPFAFLPMGLLQCIQSRISLRRLTSYLLLPELETVTLSDPPPGAVDGSPETMEGSVTMRNCSFCWNDPTATHDPITGKRKKKKKNSSLLTKRAFTEPSVDVNDAEITSPSNHFVLNDICIKINAGSLVAVVGEVGCGKSSFLSAILGEMEPLNGSKVYIPKQEENNNKDNFLAYCNQTPWVINDTVRGNIVFGRKFDYERYDKILDACALKDDLAMLPAGDLTEIGERGINLSGADKKPVSHWPVSHWPVSHWPVPCIHPTRSCFYWTIPYRQSTHMLASISS